MAARMATRTAPLLLPLLLVTAVRAAPPAEPPLPKYAGDCSKSSPSQLNACVVKSANEVLPQLVDGDRRRGIPPIDPMRLERMEFNANQLRIAFTDIDVRGCAAASVTGADVEPQKGRLSLALTVPTLRFSSNYSVDGRVLLLRIRGAGACALTLHNVKVKYICDVKVYTKNGVDYISVVNPRSSFTTDHMKILFTNLFNGDENLGKATNAFLNDNWKAVFEEVKEEAFAAITPIISSVVEGVSRVIPLRDIFSL